MRCRAFGPHCERALDELLDATIGVLCCGGMPG